MNLRLFQVWHDTWPHTHPEHFIRKSTWWHLNRKDSPHFGCQRAHQAKRAPQGAFECQQSQHSWMHTQGPLLSHPPAFTPWWARSASPPAPEAATTHLVQCGHPSRDEHQEQPWTSSWKSKGSSRKNLQLLERKWFCSFSSILFFFAHVSQIFNFLFYYQYTEEGGFKTASFSWVH